jgi:hypothetical protein
MKALVIVFLLGLFPALSLAGDWKILCSKSLMFGDKQCTAKNKNVSVTVTENGSKRVEVEKGRAVRPGTSTQLEIDGKRYTSSRQRWTGQDAERIIDRMEDGRRARLRYETPSKDTVTRNVPLRGFEKTVRELERRVKGK